MGSDKLSGRQLSVAALVGGLSHGAALCGGIDWRWALVATPAGMLLGWLLLRKAERGPLFRGAGGGALAVAYALWAVVLLSVVMERTARRIEITNAKPGDGVWLLLLFAIPVFRMAWGKSAPFFRMAEIFWLAVAALLAAMVIFAVPRIQWRWLIGSMGDWRQSAVNLTLALSPGLFTLPYIYKVEGRPRLRWQGALGGATALLAAVTAGVLSPAVAEQLEMPFFVASGVLGESVRGEGLISALWLLPDLTLAGLLVRAWGGRYGPAAAVGTALVLALTGISNYFSPVVLAVGTAFLLLLTLVIPVGKGRVVVSFW